MLLALIVLHVAPAPQTAAAECDVCDLGCFMANNPYELVEDYAGAKDRFVTRAHGCSDVDPRWEEVLDNLESMDAKGPTPRPGFRSVSELDLAMTNLQIRIKDCKRMCGGHESLELDRQCGMGGCFFECREPVTQHYCEWKSRQGARDLLDPDYSGPDGPNPAAGLVAEGGAEAPDPEPTAEPEAQTDPGEAKYMLEVAVSAEGYESTTVFAPCNVEPSVVSINGVVTDDSGAPVEGARAILVGLGASTFTNARGSYSLSVQTDGDEPFSAVLDALLVRVVGSVRATVTPLSTVYANGNQYDAVLRVTTDGRPLSDRGVSVSYWKGFALRGRKVEYVVMREGSSRTVELDGNGEARLKLESPIIPRQRLEGMTDPDRLFPVTGTLRVMVRGSAAEDECSYQVESPFPKITRLRIPGNVDAGLWQVSPSFLDIEDPDSDRFKVTVRGPGAFRLTTPRAATKHRRMVYESSPGHFEFLYRPEARGFDATKLPDVLDEFMVTSKNVYISVVTNVAGDLLIDKVRIILPEDGTSKALQGTFLDVDAKDLIGAGGNMANVVNLGSTTYTQMDDLSGGSNDPSKRFVAGGNTLIGAVDTGLGFSGALKTPQQKLAWEGFKASWEYAKMMNSISEQYHELGEAYQGLAMDPIVVRVEDANGHWTQETRACAVRVWKGGSQ